MASRFFGENADKEKMDKFKEGVGGSGLFFNGSDIDEKGTKIRIIPWLFEGEAEEFIPHYEGWEVVPPVKKGDKEKGKPLRFTLDDEIPDGINWKVNKNQFNGNMEASTPKEAIAFLAYIHKEKKIKLCGFTQATICKAFMGFKDKENEMYCADLSKVDIIIRRKAESEGKGFVITFAPQSDPNLPVEAISALEAGYMFSWPNYMSGLDPFKENEGNVWKEVLAAMKGEKPKSQANKKTETKKEHSESDLEELKTWREVKQSNGKPLGALSLPDLQKLKTLIEEKNKTNMPIYPYLEYAVANFEDDNEIAL